MSTRDVEARPSWLGHDRQRSALLCRHDSLSSPSPRARLPTRPTLWPRHPECRAPAASGDLSGLGPQPTATCGPRSCDCSAPVERRPAPTGAPPRPHRWWAPPPSGAPKVPAPPDLHRRWPGGDRRRRPGPDRRIVEPAPVRKLHDVLVADQVVSGCSATADQAGCSAARARPSAVVRSSSASRIRSTRNCRNGGPPRRPGAGPRDRSGPESPGSEPAGQVATTTSTSCRRSHS
jgi:hypothetical protein